MKEKILKGKEAFLLSLKKSSVMFTNPDKTLQALFEREGEKFLCLIKKYGSVTNPKEAISINIDEYKKSFKNCINEKWFLYCFTNEKIITGCKNGGGGLIQIQSINENLTLARDDKKQWYSVKGRMHYNPFKVGDIVPPEICEPLNEISSEFHEGIKELSDAVYSPENK